MASAGGGHQRSADGYHVVTRWLKEELPHSFVLTTNVDSYHARAGVPEVQLCERYGSQWELQCITPCRKEYWRDSRAPLCALDEERMEATSFPTCPYCGAVARPRVQMSHDPHFLEKGHDWRRYELFREDGEPDVLLVIGSTLWFSWPDGVPQPRVISINPDPRTHEPYKDMLAIPLGAKDALAGLDWMLRQLPGPRPAR